MLGIWTLDYNNPTNTKTLILPLWWKLISSILELISHLAFPLIFSFFTPFHSTFLLHSLFNFSLHFLHLLSLYSFSTFLSTSFFSFSLHFLTLFLFSIFSPYFPSSLSLHTFSTSSPHFNSTFYLWFLYNCSLHFLNSICTSPSTSCSTFFL